VESKLLYRARKLKRSGEFELEKTLINQDSPRRCGKNNNCCEAR
jgi:hypothetical protein